MLRERAIGWVKANCATAPLIANFTRQLDGAIAAGVNCSFVIGSKLTRVREPYMVYWFAGELFVFQLTRRQAMAMQVNGERMRFVRDERPLDEPPAGRKVVSLDRFDPMPERLTQATQPITGGLRYELTGEAPAGYFAKLNFTLPGLATIASFDYPPMALAARGALEVTFPPPESWTQFGMPERVMPVFVRLFEMPHPTAVNSGRPISNAVAALMQFNVVT